MAYKDYSARLLDSSLEWARKRPPSRFITPSLKLWEVGVIVVRGAGGAAAEAGDPLWGSSAITAATGVRNRSTVVPHVSVWLEHEFGSLELRKCSVHAFGDSRLPARLHAAVQHLVTMELRLSCKTSQALKLEFLTMTKFNSCHNSIV
jgi:hypothetical protein